MHWRRDILILFGCALLMLEYSECKMRTLYHGPVQPPSDGGAFDRRHWLKSTMLNKEDRCSGKGHTNGGCERPDPLGIEDGTIRDAYMTASSVYDNACNASEARLNNLAWWIASRSDPNPWIEVNLVRPSLVSGVVTQGDNGADEWRVTRYRVAYGNQSLHDSRHRNYVTDAEGLNIQEFVGNEVGAGEPVTNSFPGVIVASRVRVEPLSWTGGAAMRLELLGCRLP